LAVIGGLGFEECLAQSRRSAKENGIDGSSGYSRPLVETGGFTLGREARAPGPPVGGGCGVPAGIGFWRWHFGKAGWHTR